MAGRRNSSRALAKALHLEALLINLSRPKHGRRPWPETAWPVPAFVCSAKPSMGQGQILTLRSVKAILICREGEFSCVGLAGPCYFLQSSENRPQLVPLQKWSVKLQEGWGRKQNSLGAEQWLVTAHSLCQ